MKNLNFSPLKKLEIIIEGEYLQFAGDLLDRMGVKGYTVVNNLSGKGSHGFHDGHLMFNEADSSFQKHGPPPGARPKKPKRPE